MPERGSRPGSDELLVVAAGVLTTVQDRGRVGLAHLGVPRAGALDAPAAALGNRLVGNHADAAVLELTLGGLRAFNRGTGRWAALTGAPVDALAGRAVPFAEPFWWARDAVLEVGRPRDGVRVYLAMAGGIAVAPVLGSRSTDTLAWVGPPRVTDGTRLPLGRPGPDVRPQPLDTPPARRVGAIRLTTGPQADWFSDVPTGRGWTVRPDSDRVGLRLDGEPLTRIREGELPSEGMVLGAVQVPPSGLPIVFLADHPPTGGYPVVGIVHPDDLWLCAQLRLGEPVAFAPAGAR
ncbi:MAG: biotin-dependent carboxyltransferase family protein [Nocardioides sp.]|uniref:5-oxoprolinase subunit C family protein n=1 Tax=Nocardioides sp. TaxID=35761 RepID=UPI0039E592F6